MKTRVKTVTAAPEEDGVDYSVIINFTTSYNGVVVCVCVCVRAHLSIYVYTQTNKQTTHKIRVFLSPSTVAPLLGYKQI